MGFLNRHKKFTPVRVKEVRAIRPVSDLENDEYRADMRIVLEDGQMLDLQMDIKQLKILAINSFQVAKMFNIEVSNPIADKAATWWGMS